VAAGPPASPADRNLDNVIDKSYTNAVAHARRPVYVISIAASLVGCHPRTLRIYEDEGLVDPVRTDTNIRLYSDEDVHKVRCIRYLTQVRGVNLAGVKLLLQFRDAGDLLNEIANAIESMDRTADDDDESDERIAQPAAPFSQSDPEHQERRRR